MSFFQLFWSLFHNYFSTTGSTNGNLNGSLNGGGEGKNTFARGGQFEDRDVYLMLLRTCLQQPTSVQRLPGWAGECPYSSVLVIFFPILLLYLKYTFD